MKTVADSFREEGLIKGKKEGKNEGEYEEKMKIAERMVAKGMAVSEICEITELAINRLKN